MKHLILFFTLLFSLNVAAQSISNSEETVAKEHAIIQDKHGDNVCSKDEKVLQKKAAEPFVKRRKRYKKRMIRCHRGTVFY